MKKATKWLNSLYENDIKNTIIIFIYLFFLLISTYFTIISILSELF